MIRKLRIAWSVGWGIAAMMLVVLWVGSYSYYHEVSCPTGSVMSERGRLLWYSPTTIPFGWNYASGGIGPGDWYGWDRQVPTWHWVPIGGNADALVLPHWPFALLAA